MKRLNLETIVKWILFLLFIAALFKYLGIFKVAEKFEYVKEKIGDRKVFTNISCLTLEENHIKNYGQIIKSLMSDEMARLCEKKCENIYNKNYQIYDVDATCNLEKVLTCTCHIPS